MRGKNRTHNAPGHIHEPDRADLDPVCSPGHRNGYAYPPFCRRRMSLSRGVWEAHNPRTPQVEAPDARSAPPLLFYFTRRRHPPPLRSVAHPARRPRVHRLVVRQDRTEHGSLVKNAAIVSSIVTKPSPRPTGTGLTSVTVAIVALDDRPCPLARRNRPAWKSGTRSCPARFRYVVSNYLPT